jgi:transmembrane sensor
MSFAEARDDIQTTAAAWAVRLDRGALTPEDERALDAWLGEDVRHVGALARAEAAWCDFDRLAALDKAGVESAPRVRRRAQWQPWRAAAAAALVTVLAAGGVGYDRLAGRETSRVGEIRRLVLDDGSTVILNTDTVVQVRYHKHQRDIFLRKGEASFQVAHDKTRPFIVHAEGVSVKAVGTAFAVREGVGSVLVTVSEGVVEVARPQQKSKPAERSYVSRDRQLNAVASRPLTASVVGEKEVDRQLAWREGRLMFDGETLAQAAAEVNRYSQTSVTIDDPVLAKRAFVGVFQVGDVKSFARAAAAAFDAQLTQADDGSLHLEANPKT